MDGWRGLLVVAGAAVTLWLAAPAAGAVYGDFNGDGYADLAIGVDLEDVGAIENAGAVNVLYGSPTGLSASGDQFWHQDSAGVPGSAEAGDLFGSELAVGDFDADGFADLAVGAPEDDAAGVSNAGSVTLLYGSRTGLADDRAQLWHQGSPGVAGDGAETDDSFGSALAAANFGRGAAADLAVGVPGEYLGSACCAGAVNVLYGSASGLSTVGDQFWHQGRPGVAGDGPELGDFFGQSLAAANLGKSTHADLAVGVPFEDVGEVENAGAVNVLYGSSTGLTAAGDQFWHQGKRGLAGFGLSPFEGFGAALAAANFGRGAAADLAVGVPDDAVENVLLAGAVNVLYGSATGLTAAGNQFWHQGRRGLAGGWPEEGDGFGAALAAANFGRGAAADLAVGVPGEDVGDIGVAGAVNVLYGSATGLTAAGNQFWHQGRTGVAGDGPEPFDQFGSALAAAKFGRSAAADLAVGVPVEGVGDIGAAGAVNVLYGSATGLGTVGDQFWHQGRTGVAGDGPETDDVFGRALSPRR